MANIAWLKNVLAYAVGPNQGPTFGDHYTIGLCTGATRDPVTDTVTPVGEPAGYAPAFVAAADWSAPETDTADDYTAVVGLATTVEIYCGADDWGTLTHAVIRDGNGNVSDVVELVTPVSPLTGDSVRFSVNAARLRAR